MIMSGNRPLHDGTLMSLASKPAVFLPCHRRASLHLRVKLMPASRHRYLLLDEM